MTQATERRGLDIPVEIRSDQATGTVTVEGYAAVFGQETDIGGMFREVIRAGAFRNAVNRDDVVFVANHAGLPMARTRSGTLKLDEDAKGLRIRAELDPSDPDVKAILPKMKRGDLDKMSFGFFADRQEWDETQDPPLRTIVEASLFDVSIVTFPAYDGTSIAMRSLDATREEAKRAKGNFNAAARRIANRNRLALAERQSD
jgi:HK97 family phage prohead protease